MEIQSFSIFKNDRKVAGSNQPDYTISAKDEKGNFVKWGAGWIKEGKSGKYISCSKSKPKEVKSQADIDYELL